MFFLAEKHFTTFGATSQFSTKISTLSEAQRIRESQETADAIAKVLRLQQELSNLNTGREMYDAINVNEQMKAANEAEDEARAKENAYVDAKKAADILADEDPGKLLSLDRAEQLKKLAETSREKANAIAVAYHKIDDEIKDLETKIITKKGELAQARSDTNFLLAVKANETAVETERKFVQANDESISATKEKETAKTEKQKAEKAYTDAKTALEKLIADTVAELELYKNRLNEFIEVAQ
ncbi:MAG: hypothetical protein HZC51_03935 [Nitrospirae bacterium]|nr:hypothetical protein [Nitrospirota bacterium]